MEYRFFEPEVYRTFFGVEDDEDIQFAEEMLEALEKIDRALVPRKNTHPYLDLIRQGQDGVPALLGYLKEPMKGTKEGDVMDALSFVFLNMSAPPEALDAVRGFLTSETFGPAAARTLAIGQDRAFLADMMGGLGSDDPGDVASAAMLMGYGRFQESVPVLLNLISPTRFFESRSVLWALGEIGAQDAIPYIERCLAESFRPVDAMIALGKIGNLGTIGSLLPYIFEGDSESRAMGLRSFSMILAKNAEFPEAIGALKESLLEPLRKVALEDEDRTTRFYALLCLGRMGDKMRKEQVRQALDMSLPEKDMSSMQNFFLRRSRGSKNR